MSYLANILTFLHLACGFSSILFSLQGNFLFACWAIMLAAAFDGLDGTVARAILSSGEIGKELDALCDAVSFGVAPFVAVYTFSFSPSNTWQNLALFLYLLCSIIRLARFNSGIKERAASFFYGFPTTAAAVLIVSALLFSKRDMGSFLPRFEILLLMLSFFMVSRIKYPNLSGLRRIFGVWIWVLGIAFLIALSVYKENAPLVLFAVYLFLSPFLVRKAFK